MAFGVRALIGLNSEESMAALERELSQRGLLLQKGVFILRPLGGKK